MGSGSVNSRSPNIPQKQKNDDANIIHDTPSFLNDLPTESVTSKCSRFIEKIRNHKYEKTEERLNNTTNTITNASSAPKENEMETRNESCTLLNMQNIEKSQRDIILQLVDLFFKMNDSVAERHAENNVKNQSTNIREMDSGIDTTMHEITTTSVIIAKNNSTGNTKENLTQNDVSKVNEEAITSQISLPPLDKDKGPMNDTNAVDPVPRNGRTDRFSTASLNLEDNDHETVPRNTRRRSLQTLRPNPKVSRSKFENLFVAYHKEKSSKGTEPKTKKRRRVTVNSEYPKNKRRKLFSMNLWIESISEENDK